MCELTLTIKQLQSITSQCSNLHYDKIMEIMKTNQRKDYEPKLKTPFSKITKPRLKITKT